MRPADVTRKLLGLAETLHRWLGALTALDVSRRDRIAGYDEAIAGTLHRCADALARLAADPNDAEARGMMVRELGRISRYIETMVSVLAHDLDGRKLAGVKRRLELLAAESNADLTPVPGHRLQVDGSRIDRLLAAEGYFRALADGLRA